MQHKQIEFSSNDILNYENLTLSKNNGKNSKSRYMYVEYWTTI